MKDFTKISVLENDKIIKAIFGKDLPRFEKTNPFAYAPSSGYYDDNKVMLNIGIVFATPKGRDSIVYPHRLITIKENEISGKSEWVSDNGTPAKVKDRLLSVTSNFDYIFKGTPLKANYDRGIKYLVVSSGSGGIPCYKLSLDDL